MYRRGVLLLYYIFVQNVLLRYGKKTIAGAMFMRRSHGSRETINVRNALQNSPADTGGSNTVEIETLL